MADVKKWEQMKQEHYLHNRNEVPDAVFMALEIAESRAALQAQQGDAGNPASGDALDAARYRWLRDSPDSGRCIRAMYEDGISHPNDVDALVDAAMLAARREG